ncbi:MAG: DUF192 domain-containing protein [Alphaproteobacteria bacterium]|nr:DUF192 domain-containing protein [Alphaproteobacteria bacterium]
MTINNLVANLKFHQIVTMANFWRLLVFMLALQATIPASANDSAHALAAYPALETQPLTILGENGQSFVFKIEIASEPQEQSRGLMHRKTMSPDAGMLFVWDSERPVNMWMKNTHLSLDMLFIDAQGIIVHIAPRTTPLSEAIIDSKQPVSAVLELLGGTTEKHAIKVGNRVIHPHFKPSP